MGEDMGRRCAIQAMNPLQKSSELDSGLVHLLSAVTAPKIVNLKIVDLATIRRGHRRPTMILSAVRI
jgi:hypothetical protein